MVHEPRTQRVRAVDQFPSGSRSPSTLTFIAVAGASLLWWVAVALAAGVVAECKGHLRMHLFLAGFAPGACWCAGRRTARQVGVGLPKAN